MNLRKKMVLLSVLPVVVLGMLSLIMTMTLVKDSLVGEVETALKGTAAATLAAYEQNSGDYLVTENGDLWKGSYNISKSENLVDNIKAKSGMDVTFFYGNKRIMTSAFDADHKRILGSPAGETIVEKVLNQKEEYFSDSISLDGEFNYGYYMPVYQNEQEEDAPVGMIFVGVNKAEKDAAIGKIVSRMTIMVLVVMMICLIVAVWAASTITKHLKKSIDLVHTVATGNLSVDIDQSLLKRKDEIGLLSQAMSTLKEELRDVMTDIAKNAEALTAASENMGKSTEYANGSMNQVKEIVDSLAVSSTRQAENTMDTASNMAIMGDNITETAKAVEGLHENAALMKESSEKAEKTILKLQEINQKAESSIHEVEKQTELTNESVQKIQEATTLIASIAQETTMLSLNARIEASRAGESGKGFAVVANHISDLADQTNQSSADIAAITAVLMNNSTKAVEIMQQMKEVIAEQNQSMEDTRAVVRTVLEEIGFSIEGISQIRETAIRLENSRNEVVEAVEQLSEIAKTTEENTHSTNRETVSVAETLQKLSLSAKDLKSISDELVNSIEYFSI